MGAGAVTFRGPTPGTLRFTSEGLELCLYSELCGVVIFVECVDDECEKIETLSFDGDALRVEGGDAAWLKAIGARAACKAENERRSAGPDIEMELWGDAAGDVRGVKNSSKEVEELVLSVLAVRRSVVAEGDDETGVSV
jgi:hypothetical protein